MIELSLILSKWPKETPFMSNKKIIPGRGPWEYRQVSKIVKVLVLIFISMNWLSFPTYCHEKSLHCFVDIVIGGLWIRKTVEYQRVTFRSWRQMEVVPAKKFKLVYVYFISFCQIPTHWFCRHCWILAESGSRFLKCSGPLTFAS